MFFGSMQQNQFFFRVEHIQHNWRRPASPSAFPLLKNVVQITETLAMSAVIKKWCPRAKG